MKRPDIREAVREAAFNVAELVFDDRSQATIRILTADGWRSRRTTLRTARAWRAYFGRRWPHAATELIITGPSPELASIRAARAARGERGIE